MLLSLAIGRVSRGGVDRRPDADPAELRPGLAGPAIRGWAARQPLWSQVCQLDRDPLIITGNDDIFPCRDRTSADLHADFRQRFPDGFGCMHLARHDLSLGQATDSLWMGSAYASRVNGVTARSGRNTGITSWTPKPVWSPGRMGRLWRRPEYGQQHKHWSLVPDARPRSIFGWHRWDMGGTGSCSNAARAAIPGERGSLMIRSAGIRTASIRAAVIAPGPSMPLALPAEADFRSSGEPGGDRVAGDSLGRRGLPAGLAKQANVIGSPTLLTANTSATWLRANGHAWRGEMVEFESLHDWLHPNEVDWPFLTALAAIVYAGRAGATQIDCFGMDWTGTLDWDGTAGGLNRSNERWQKGSAHSIAWWRFLSGGGLDWNESDDLLQHHSGRRCRVFDHRCAGRIGGCDRQVRQCGDRQCDCLPRSAGPGTGHPRAGSEPAVAAGIACFYRVRHRRPDHDQQRRIDGDSRQAPWRNIAHQITKIETQDPGGWMLFLS